MVAKRLIVSRKKINGANAIFTCFNRNSAEISTNTSASQKYSRFFANTG